jgi:tetratricopeptide (TPR) repeat protein
MASETTPRQPISPEKRRIFQMCFERGSKAAAQGQFDYATDMFTQCIQGDPGNRIYVSNFLGNLQKKYNNNKTGGKLSGMRSATTKGAIKKAEMQKDWLSVLKNGAEVLKLNPWDTSTLVSMAAACDALGFDDCQVAYLQAALDFDIKDVEINRLMGRTLERQGQFDKSSTCWQRVLVGKGGKDEEAQRAIANLAVKKTIKEGGYESAESSTDAMVDKEQQSFRRGETGPQITPEQKLEKAISKNPTDLPTYIELADLHLRNERFEQAEAVFAKALEVSGGDMNIRERLEDTQLRRAREQLAQAEKRAQAEGTDEAKSLVKRLKTELNNKELEIYRSRMDRYPTNLALKFEVAERLKRGKLYKEAIPLFQKALADPRRKGAVMLSLGECFHHIEQFRLAMSNYEQAVQEIPARDEDLKKLALYRAGKLAYGLKDLDTAEKYLTELAGLDFGYEDVSEWLDKIAKKRNDGPDQK